MQVQSEITTPVTDQMQMGKNGGCVAYMQKIKGASRVSVVKSKTERTNP